MISPNHFAIYHLTISHSDINYLPATTHCVGPSESARDAVEEDRHSAYL